jgi:hypothetical protein
MGTGDPVPVAVAPFNRVMVEKREYNKRMKTDPFILYQPSGDHAEQSVGSSILDLDLTGHRSTFPSYKLVVPQ